MRRPAAGLARFLRARRAPVVLGRRSPGAVANLRRLFENQPLLDACHRDKRPCSVEFGKAAVAGTSRADRAGANVPRSRRDASARATLTPFAGRPERRPVPAHAETKERALHEGPNRASPDSGVAPCPDSAAAGRESACSRAIDRGL